MALCGISLTSYVRYGEFRFLKVPPVTQELRVSMKSAYVRQTYGNDALVMMLQIGAVVWVVCILNIDSGNTTNVGGEQECHHEEEGEDDQIISSFQRIALTFSTHYSTHTCIYA